MAELHEQQQQQVQQDITQAATPAELDQAKATPGGKLVEELLKGGETKPEAYAEVARKHPRDLEEMMTIISQSSMGVDLANEVAEVIDGWDLNAPKLFPLGSIKDIKSKAKEFEKSSLTWFDSETGDFFVADKEKQEFQYKGVSGQVKDGGLNVQHGESGITGRVDGKGITAQKNLDEDGKEVVSGGVDFKNQSLKGDYKNEEWSAGGSVNVKDGFGVEAHGQTKVGKDGTLSGQVGYDDGTGSLKSQYKDKDTQANLNANVNADGYNVGVSGSQKVGKDDKTTLTGSASISEKDDAQTIAAKVGASKQLAEKEKVTAGLGVTHTDDKTTLDANAGYHYDGGNVTGKAKVDSEGDYDLGVQAQQKVGGGTLTEHAGTRQQGDLKLSDLGLKYNYGTDDMAFQGSLLGQHSNQDGFSAKGQFDGTAKLGDKTFLTGQGQFKVGENQDFDGMVRAGITHIPTDKLALTLEGAVGTGGAYDARLTAEILKKNPSKVGELSKAKKDAIFKVWVGVQGGQNSLLDQHDSGRFGGTHDFGGGGGGPRVGAGFSISF